MLVSLELKAIADKYGVLSPEMALGYRAVKLAQREYESLDDVRATILNATAAKLALEAMLRPNAVSVRDCGRHAYTFCHTSTGSVLRLEALPDALSLPARWRVVEDRLLRGQPIAEAEIAAYSGIVSEMVCMLLLDPPECLFSVKRYRCRPIGRYPDVLCRFQRCDRCGAWVRLNRLYDVEGFRLCAPCADVEPFWFASTSAIESALPEQLSQPR